MNEIIIIGISIYLITTVILLIFLKIKSINIDDITMSRDLAVRSRDNYKEETMRVLAILDEERSESNMLIAETESQNTDIINEKDKIIKQVVNINNNLEKEARDSEKEIKALKKQIHKEQVDSNNQHILKEKWKAKFEILTNTVKEQGFGKQVIAKYKKAWKAIVLLHKNKK